MSFGFNLNQDRKNMIFAKGLSMQWVKIFSGLEEAQSRLQHDKPQLVIIHGTRVMLVQHQSKFYATQNACTHSGASLSDGSINYLGEIICPLHNYQFDLQTGRECNGRSADLKTFPIKINDTGFFIGI
jgi:nitrite reductase/ring-hydroxylating ferredoxin subunit